MQYQISKSFAFCYGHRVWSQTLDNELSLNQCLKCRHLHGHQAKVTIYLESDVLKDGMVTDFAHLNWFKKFLEDTIDHKFIIDINDPLFDTLLPIKKENLKQKNGYKIVDSSFLNSQPNHIAELYESFIVVDFIPTSEELSNWLLKIVQERMKKLNIKVSKVKFCETEKSQSIAFR